MSRRPDRRKVIEGTVKKQESDAENNHGGGGDYINPFKFPEGVEATFLSLKPEERYDVDIIPFEVTSKNHPAFKQLEVYPVDGGEYREDYAMTYFVHKKIGPGGKATVPCPEMNWGKPCPICDERKRILAEKEMEWDDDELTPYKYKSRTILNILDSKDDAIKLLDYPTAWFLKNLLNKSKRVRGAESQVCMSDISEEGYSISFFPETSNYKTKKGDPVAGEIKDIEFIKRKEALDESLMDDAFSVDKYMNVFTFEELEAIMHGEDIDDTTEKQESKKETPVEEKPEMSDREKRIAERNAKKNEESGDDKKTCPNNMTFGTDNLTDEVCDDCPLLDECEKEYNRVNG